MIWKKAPILLLTACINSGGMSFTALQDPGVRKRQYVDALRYYLDNASLRIVFCENTGYDMSEQFSEDIASNRLEYMTFDGNRYDRTLGKGYGEALIIQHALCNSSFINDSDGYVIKITGRIIVENISDIIKHAQGFGRTRSHCNFIGPFFSECCHDVSSFLFQKYNRNGSLSN